jgi:hypothetical protein
MFKITPLHGPHGKHRLSFLWMQVYGFVAWHYTSYSSVLLISIVSCIRVYRAVAWQLVDKIRYIMLIFVAGIA